MAYIYKFSDTATETHSAPKTIEQLKEVYMSGSTHSQMSNLLSSGVEKCLGWCYNYQDDLKEFYYTQYGTTSRSYAPNKTCLRKAVYGTISDIVEIK